MQPVTQPHKSPFSRPALLAAVVLLGFLFATNVYRAATQSIAHDEALTYQFYLSRPSSFLFTFYDANHHFLCTLLMKLSTSLFGYSELSMRLTSLAAGGLYFYTVYQLCLLLFGDGLFFLLSVAALSLNPIILDFFVAARGYGPGLALLAFGLYSMMRYAISPGKSRRLLYLAGAALSLAVMANLTYLFPAFVFALLFLIVVLLRISSQKEQPKQQRKDKRRGSHPSREPSPSRVSEMKHFVAPVIVFAFVFWLLAPVQKVKRRSFAQVTSSFASTLQDTVHVSFAHNEGIGGINRNTASLHMWFEFLSFVLFPGVLAAGLLVSRRRNERSPAALSLFLISGGAAGLIAVLIAAHHLLRAPYPSDRTGLYLPFLFVLTLLLLVQVLRERTSAIRFAAIPFLLVAGLFTLHYAVQFNWTHFYVWPYDANNRQILDRLASTVVPGSPPVRLGISWQLEPSFNYYRRVRRLAWLWPPDRSGPRGDYQYYVLIPQDRSLIKEMGLKVIYEGPVSGTVLAEATR